MSIPETLSIVPLCAVPANRRSIVSYRAFTKITRSVFRYARFNPAGFPGHRK